MKEEDIYEINLPKYLKNDIERVIKGRKEKSKLLDCFLDELYGSINSAYYSNEITKEQADYLRCKYLFKKEG